MNECCKDERNRRIHLELIGDDQYLKTTQCKVCGGPMNECCTKPENLELVEKSGGFTRSPTGEVSVRQDLQISKCKECGRRHFELTLDPGVIGLELKR